jgi:hypothetical protein
LVACGGTTTNNGNDAGGGDSSTKPDTSTGTDGGGDTGIPLGDAGAFCTGNTSRIMINGTEQSVVSATGRQLVLNCCDSAELTVATTAYQAYLNVLWRAPAGGGTSPIDLANPPTGFQMELDLGCDPATTACATASPEERYADGFQGTLTYTYDTAGLKTGYCLTVSEPPQTPHAIIHTMTLYTPAILCAY